MLNNRWTIGAQRCELHIHDLVDGKYLVKRVFGSGDEVSRYKVDYMGQEFVLKLFKVWQADPVTKQIVAIRATSEIASCMIDSHYLEPIVGHGVVSGNPYIITPCTNSTDLSRIISNGRRINEVSILSQILYGLRDLHCNGKVHCSLMPENIRVLQNGNVQITNYVTIGDRGKILEDRHRGGAIDKAAVYLAPEYFKVDHCATVLPAADIFSFGVLAFQVLTGELPFGHAMSEVEMNTYQSKAGGGVWKKLLLSRVSEKEKWSQLFEGCFNPKPGDRPTAEQAIELLTGTPAQGEPSCRFHHKAISGIMLKVVQGEEFGRVYHLNELAGGNRRILTVGRSDRNVFNIIPITECASTYISRNHCTIELDDATGEWYIRDGQWNKLDTKNWFRSLNGTYLNSLTVTDEGMKISIGDIISIGDAKLRVEGY